MIRKIGEVIAIAFGALLTLLAIAVFSVIASLYPKYESYKEEAKKVVEGSSSDNFKQNLTSYIYDKDDNLLAELKTSGNKVYLEYESIPKNVTNAFIAIEDNDFWEHPGYNIKAIIRVGFNYIKTKGKEKHGASTITQQLARNSFITKEVTIERKIKEICYAIEIEKKYSKEEILEFYTNNIFFSNNCYGIEAASNYYFNKDADELSLSEIAYLCAIPNAPSYYNPLKNKNTAIPRRNKILNDMYNLQMITEKELNDAISEEIILNVNKGVEINDYQTTYAVDCAVKYLMKIKGFEFKYYFGTMNEYEEYIEYYNIAYESMRKALYSGGYTVKTTLDSEKQKIAQEKLDEILSFSEETKVNGQYALQGAVTIINNYTGKVEAVIGGRSDNEDGYTINRAYQGYRQPGSSIKPLIVYLPALEKGYTDSSIVKNISVNAAKENPKKVLYLDGAEMTLRSAIVNSKNGAAWRLFCELTPDVGLLYLNNMRFGKIVPNDYYPAASLGGFTYGTTTVEMASAYSCIVNHGMYKQPDCVISILNRNGKEIYSEEETIRIYGEEECDLMIDMLKDVVSVGTAKGMGWGKKVEAAGKTGTTNKSKDGWFVGMTPDYSMAVWVGYDEPKELTNLYGGTYPAKIWKNIMTELTKEPINVRFKTAQQISDDSEKYLPGRSESEELSPGYTVGNYRKDHELADEARSVLNEIISQTLDKSLIMVKYEEAKLIVNKIYGQTLKKQMNDELNEIYEKYIR